MKRLGGSFANGFSGGLAGVRAGLDAFGVVTLSIICGLRDSSQMRLRSQIVSGLLMLTMVCQKSDPVLGSI